MQYLLDDVGANLRVRPSRVVLSNRFIQGKRRFPTRAHTRVRPYVIKAAIAILVFNICTPFFLTV